MQKPNTLSFWESDLLLRPADVAVIGGGIVGLHAALRLKQLRPQWEIVIIERSARPLGASTRNAGFACIGSPTELLADLQCMPEQSVWDLVAMRWEGLKRLRERVSDNEMLYEPSGSYEIFREADAAAYSEAAAALPYLNKQLRSITGIDACLSLSDSEIQSMGFAGVQYLIRNDAEGQLHPGVMLRSLRAQASDAGIRYIADFPVSDIIAQGNGWQIESKAWNTWLHSSRVLVATNGFAQRLLPDLPLKPARNQVLLTAPIPSLPFKACFHYQQGYFYFRNVGKRVLIGGGRHLDKELEQTDAFGLTSRIQSALEELLQHSILPGKEVSITHRWSGILGVGEQKQPIIKKHASGLYVAVRLGGMGIAIGSMVGERAAELVVNEISVSSGQY